MKTKSDFKLKIDSVNENIWYEISADKYNWIIITHEKGKKFIPRYNKYDITTTTSTSYPSTFKDALKYIMYQDIKHSDAKSIKDVINTLKQIEDNIDKYVNN